MNRRLELLTFKQLRALDAVARDRAINRAADRLNLTPPAVHNQLKALEENMGCQLLDRGSADGFGLTEAGEALLGAYQEGRGALERALNHIDAVSEGRAGGVVLGVVSTGKYLAPGLVARIRRDLPDIRLRLEIGNRSETIAALTQRRYDLCIMGRPPRQPAVNAEPLAEHPHIIVGAPDNPLAGRDQLSAEDFFGQTFLMREPGSGTRILTARYLDEILEGREVDTLEMGSNETIKQAVISGLGIAMLSGHTVVEELRTGRLVALRCPGTPVMRKWYLVARRDQQLTRTAERVRGWILEHAPAILPQVLVEPDDARRLGRGAEA